MRGWWAGWLVGGGVARGEDCSAAAFEGANSAEQRLGRDVLGVFAEQLLSRRLGRDVLGIFRICSSATCLRLLLDRKQEATTRKLELPKSSETLREDTTRDWAYS